MAASHRGWVDTYGAEPLQTAFQRRGWSAPGRLVEVRTNGGRPVAVAGNASLPLGDPRPGPWGAVLAAPDSETGLPGVAAQLGELARLDIPPVLVAVHGGTTLTRMLVCEQIRLHERLPALLIDPDAADDAPTRDRAVTAVLSGRADLVGVPPMTSTVPHHQSTATDAGLSALFAPRGIAVVGASRRPQQARRDAGPLAQRLRRARRPPGAGERPRRDDAPVVWPPPPRQARSISP